MLVTEHGRKGSQNANRHGDVGAPVTYAGVVTAGGNIKKRVLCSTLFSVRTAGTEL
jgi:hypothetical protein